MSACIHPIRRCTFAVAIAAFAVLALTALGAASPALAASEPFRFLPGSEGFDGSLPAGEPSSYTGEFAFPFSDAEDAGPPDTQAGSHPYALTVGFASENTNHELKQWPIGWTAKGVVEREGEKEKLEEEQEKLEEEEKYTEAEEKEEARHKIQAELIVPEGPPISALRDAAVNLPHGLVVDPSAATAKCTSAQFAVTTPEVEEEGRGCPIASVVGVATLYLELGIGRLAETRDPVYELEAPGGVPAEFGFDDKGSGLDVVLAGRVRTGGDYGLSAEAHDVLSKLAILGASVTLWGNPSDPSHDRERGYCASEQGQLALEEHKIEPCSAPRTNTALLTLPSACSGPLETTIQVDSWQQPGVFTEDSFLTHGEHDEPVGVEGCSSLSFNPSIAVRPVEPEAAAADSPSGLRVDLHVPQSEQYGGLATANLRNTVVTLPEGMVVNPSAAGGLEGCPLLKGTEAAKEEREAKGEEVGIDLESKQPANCPDASKIGTVEVDTPLLEHPLPGAVYLAKQTANPFGSLLALYIAVHDPVSGVVVKLAGHVELAPSTGRLTTTFDENPELPFEDFKLDFFGGPRAPLTTPPVCGTYTTETSLTPWSGTPAVAPLSRFAVSRSCATGGFAPSFSAGTTNNQAGASSSFTLTFSRNDGEQHVSGVQVTMPQGLLGKVAGIPQCPEPQASKGECAEASLLGEATTAVGSGPEPYWVTGGKVYLTGPYNGGPFGLSIVVPTTAGPFTLTGDAGPGKEVVRASIRVNPSTAQITVVSDPFPTILEGVPLDIRTVNVTVNRSGFMLNPTDCEGQKIEGTISSTGSASEGVSSPFEAANCAALAFHPSFSASTEAHTSKEDGASLVVKVGQTAGEANIHKVDLTLPKILPARLTTLHQACTEAQFDSNPAGCPAGSFIGAATAHTPVLNAPLTGPAILVSHGNAAFPDVEFLLQGEGVEILLDGKTDIKGGITYSKFETVPDAPISSFETTLPESPHSVLTTEHPGQTNLCAPTTPVTVIKRVQLRRHGHVVRRHGHAVYVKRKLTEHKPESLAMPTTIVGQNGAVLTQTTKIAVTGCAKAAAKAPTKAKKQAKGHKKQRG